MGLWWVRRGDQTFGPVDESALVNALREGRIQPGDLACREGGQEWLLVSSVPGVAEVFAPKRSQPPIQGQDPWREAAWMIGNMDGEITEGPLSLDDVKVHLARGTLTGGELIARVGSSAWQQIPEILAEHTRALSNRPAPAVPTRTTIPPVPLPTGHPSSPPPRPAPTRTGPARADGTRTDGAEDSRGNAGPVDSTPAGAPYDIAVNRHRGVDALHADGRDRPRVPGTTAATGHAATAATDDEYRPTATRTASFRDDANGTPIGLELAVVAPSAARSRCCAGCYRSLAGASEGRRDPMVGTSVAQVFP